MERRHREESVRSRLLSQSALDVEAAFRHIARHFLDRISQQVDFAWGTIYLLDRENAQLRPLAQRGEEADFIEAFRFRFGNGLSAWALERRKVIRLHNIHHGRRHRHHPVRSYVVFPLVHGNVGLGALTLAHCKPHAFSEQECRYLARMTRKLSRLLLPLIFPPS